MAFDRPIDEAETAAATALAAAGPAALEPALNAGLAQMFTPPPPPIFGVG